MKTVACLENESVFHGFYDAKESEKQKMDISENMKFSMGDI